MSLHFPCTWTMTFLLHNSKKLISGQCCKTRWPHWCGPTAWRSFPCPTHHSNSPSSLWTQVLHSHHCVLHEAIPPFPERSNISMRWLARNTQQEALTCVTFDPPDSSMEWLQAKFQTVQMAGSIPWSTIFSHVTLRYLTYSFNFPIYKRGLEINT